MCICTCTHTHTQIYFFVCFVVVAVKCSEINSNALSTPISLYFSAVEDEFVQDSLSSVFLELNIHTSVYT